MKRTTKTVEDQKWLRGISTWIIGSIMTLLVGGEAGGAALLILQLLVLVIIVAIIIAIIDPKKIFYMWVEDMPLGYWYLSVAISTIATVIWITYIPVGFVFRLLSVMLIGFGIITMFVYGAILHIQKNKKPNNHH